MKRAILLLIAVLASWGATRSQADEILIYKYSSTRPWAQYDCHRPIDDLLGPTPPVPKSTRAGTYTQTEYWIINKTTEEFQVINYYSYVDRGAKIKEYEAYPLDGLTREIEVDDFEGNPYTVQYPIFQYLQAGLPSKNQSNVCVTYGSHFFDPDTDENNDGNDDLFQSDEEGHFSGLGKPFTVATGMVINDVAPTLTGNYVYSELEELSGPTGIGFLSVYFESPSTHKLTLDVIATKNANTGAPLTPYGGGAPLTNGTSAYGLRVAELILEKLGYENVDAP